MNEPETIDPRELNPLALAFVGDSVLELLVRTRLARHHRMSAGKLNVEKVKYVSARAQFREEQLLEPLFTEEELAVFKRGRNASKASVAKHASPEAVSYTHLGGGCGLLARGSVLLVPFQQAGTRPERKGALCRHPAAEFQVRTQLVRVCDTRCQHIQRHADVIFLRDAQLGKYQLRHRDGIAFELF